MKNEFLTREFQSNLYFHESDFKPYPTFQMEGFYCAKYFHENHFLVLTVSNGNPTVP